jgi:hypothetical protein
MTSRIEPEESPKDLDEVANVLHDEAREAMRLLKKAYAEAPTPPLAEAIAELEPILFSLGIVVDWDTRN